MGDDGEQMASSGEEEGQQDEDGGAEPLEAAAAALDSGGGPPFFTDFFKAVLHPRSVVALPLLPTAHESSGFGDLAALSPGSAQVRARALSPTSVRLCLLNVCALKLVPQRVHGSGREQRHQRRCAADGSSQNSCPATKHLAHTQEQMECRQRRLPTRQYATLPKSAAAWKASN